MLGEGQDKPRDIAEAHEMADASDSARGLHRLRTELTPVVLRQHDDRTRVASARNSSTIPRYCHWWRLLTNTWLTEFGDVLQR